MFQSAVITSMWALSSVTMEIRYQAMVAIAEQSKLVTPAQEQARVHAVRSAVMDSKWDRKSAMTNRELLQLAVMGNTSSILNQLSLDAQQIVEQLRRDGHAQLSELDAMQFVVMDTTMALKHVTMAIRLLVMDAVPHVQLRQVTNALVLDLSRKRCALRSVAIPL